MVMEESMLSSVKVRTAPQIFPQPKAFFRLSAVSLASSFACKKNKNDASLSLIEAISSKEGTLPAVLRSITDAPAAS